LIFGWWWSFRNWTCGCSSLCLVFSNRRKGPNFRGITAMGPALPFPSFSPFG
jgi:hypothetical protein